MNRHDFDTEYNPLFNPIQQRNDAIIYAKKLANELKNLSLQNLALKHEINGLKTKNKHKDKLLDKKSKQIINSTSEILRLKQEIEKLKNKLNKLTLSKHHSKSNKKKQRKSFIMTKRNSLSLSLSVQSSFDSDLDEYIETNNDEMPYVLPQISTNLSTSSALSAQACKLSFPLTQDSNPPPYIPKAPIIRVLSPIAENNTNDEELKELKQSKSCNKHKIMTPTLLKVSDNNINIQIDEWIDCMASIDSSDNIHDFQSDDESSISYRSDTEILMEKNMRQSTAGTFSDDEYSISKQSVSYMSDNTIMLMDICLDSNGSNKDLLRNNKLGHNNRLDIELSMTEQQAYKNKSSDHLSGCDNIIKAPFNLLDNNAICNV